MTFKAIRVGKTDAGQNVQFVEMDARDLMDGDVTVRVTHSTVNYKDGLALSGKSAIPRKFPLVLGVDLAGVVESSVHDGFRPGDAVFVNGFGLGETHSGGYAQLARVKGDWLLKNPEGWSGADVMAVGTAGYTAALSVDAIEAAGATPAMGPAVVTGAAGGVGSVAIALLARAGWSVIASTGARRGGGLSEVAGRQRDHRARQPFRPCKTARQRALGGGRRQRRLAHARQSALADPLWRRHRRLRTRRRHGPADVGRAFHLARRQTAGHR